MLSACHVISVFHRGQISKVIDIISPILSGRVRERKTPDRLLIACHVRLIVLLGHVK
jgi:hypothetical protein